MFPKIFSFGDFFLPAYGLFVALGFLAGLQVATRLAKRSGLDPDKVSNVAVFGALAGLAGAKVLMIILDLGYYMEHPGDILSMSTLQAAGVFYGGLIAALVVGFWMLRRDGLPAIGTLDVYAPGLAIGQAIGRVGCLAAGCCWGNRCDRPWAITFTDPEAHRLTDVPLNIPLHPSQVYEALATFAIFAFLWWIFPRRKAPGEVLGWYLTLSGISRFSTDFFREHQQAHPFGLALSSAQWISIGLMILGAALLVTRANRRAPATV